MEIVLHIGTDKTGTSSIQATLSKSREKMLEYGVLYPSLRHSGMNHNFLVTGFQSSEKLPREYKSRFDRGKLSLPLNFKQAWSDLRDQCISVNPKKLVLSGEYLGSMDRVASEKFIAELINLTESSSPIKVVIYVRRPSSHYSSSLQQIIKASQNIPKPSSWRYKFKSTIIKWLDFNSISVDVNIFDKKYLKSGNVVFDFCSKYIEEIPFDEISEVKANVSLSAESAYILWDFRRKFYSQKDNIFLPESNKLLNDLQDIEKTQKIPVHKFAIKKAIANLVDRNNLEDIHWLQEKYGLSLGVSNQAMQQDYFDIDSNNLSDYLENVDSNSIYQIMQHLLVCNY